MKHQGLLGGGVFVIRENGLQAPDGDFTDGALCASILRSECAYKLIGLVCLKADI